VIQNRALEPHVLRSSQGDDSGQSAGEAQDSDLASFSDDEVAIRDDYDTLLDGLERFASYVDTGLISVEDLRPYLGYWIKDIASTQCGEVYMGWTFWLLLYIDYYDFAGVESLFQAFGYNVRLGADIYLKCMVAAGDSAWRAVDTIRKRSAGAVREL
jgi:hypothetical protein